MKTRIFGYDLIRTAAILLVMLGHVLGYVYQGTFSFFYAFLAGFLGVELFFVLSGVLIGGLLIRVFRSGPVLQNLKTFVFRRWLRTLPLYFAVLPVYAVGNYLLDPVKNADVPLWKYFFFIQNFFAVQPTFFGVSWSLSVEEWFYLLFPFLLLLVKKGQPSLSLKFLFLTGISVFLIYFLGMRLMAFSEYHFTFYEGIRKVAFFRLDAIAYGILVAVMMYFYPPKKMFTVLLLLAGLVVLSFNQHQIFKNNYSELQYFNTFYYSVLGLGLALIFPFFKQLHCPESFGRRSITFISKISYSLYLTHWLVYKFLEIPLFSGISDWGKFFIFFILSFLLATFTYLLIEKPMMQLREKWTASRSVS